MEPNLPLLMHLTGLLAEAEDPPETGRVDRTAPGVTQNDLWRQIVDAPRGIGAVKRPMAPKLIILHKLGMLPIDQRAR